MAPAIATPVKKAIGAFKRPPPRRSPGQDAKGDKATAMTQKAEKERKENDEVAKLKERLAKGHRLNDAELAQLELAAVARAPRH